MTRYENGKEKTSWNCKYGLTDFKSIGRHAQKTYRIGNIKNDFAKFMKNVATRSLNLT